jgi:hypothetical protein
MKFMHSDNWLTNFIKQKLSTFQSILKIETIEDNLVHLTRKEGSPFLTYTISLENVPFSDIKRIVSAESNINFIVNIKKHYKIDGDTIDFLNSKKISFGGMGDLMRYSNQDDNSLYEDKEYSFIRRGLEQHTAVSSFQRLDNKRIKINRYSMKDFIIVLDNDYDLNTESVRSYKSRFDTFEVILSNNPNARITTDAYALAKTMDIDICTWGEFLGKLKRFWN